MSDSPQSDTPQIDRLGTLLPGDRLSRRPGRFQRFDFHAGPVAVPAMLWSRPEPSDHLVIAFNGAVRRTDDKNPHEVFQRRTWVDDIEADVLFLSDPTLNVDNGVSIGWGQGVSGRYAIPAMAQTARFTAESLDVPASSRLYFGTSAGGFQALQAATRDEGSRALVNNAQIDWTRYMPVYVSAICRYSHAGLPPEEIARKHPDRTSAASAFTEFGHVPRARYLINVASENDARAQLPALIDSHPAVSGESARIDVSLYSDARGGHNPLGRSATADAINNILRKAAHA